MATLDNLKQSARENSGMLGDTALRSGLTTISGGFGAGLRRAADAAAEETVDRTAERLATRFRQREEDDEALPAPKKKLVGPAFFAVLALAILKDLSDIAADASIIMTILTPLTGLFVTLVITTYFLVNKVALTSKKAVLYLISLVIEFVPLINAIPTTAIVLIGTRWMENRKKS